MKYNIGDIIEGYYNPGMKVYLLIEDIIYANKVEPGLYSVRNLNENMTYDKSISTIDNGYYRKIA